MMQIKRKMNPGRRKARKAAVLFRTGMALLLVAVTALLAACVQDLDTGGSKEPVEYVICDENHLPEQLHELLEEKKRKPAAFAYRNTMYLYLVVCYGKKEYGGCSVRVEEMYRTKDTIFLKTQLQGPSASEPVVEAESFPWIVLRCARTDAFCVIDP